MYPVTTGGRLSGKSTKPLSREWPQKRPRASAIAIPMPNGRLRRVATTATLRLSWIAVNSSGLRVIQSMASSTQLIYYRQERRRDRRRLVKHRKSLSLKERLGLARFDVGE